MRKKMTAMVGISVALIIGIITMVYLSHMSNSIHGTIMTNIAELTAHDVKAVESHITRSWTDLENIAARIQFEECSSLEELQPYLAQERAASIFSALYLLDANGNAYMDTYKVLSPQEHSFIRNFEDSVSDRFVVWNQNSNTYADSRKAYLLYGVETDRPIQIGDLEIIGIIGQAKINDIREQLQIESYNGLGNSRIVDKNGNYIVVPLAYSNSTVHDNIWTTISGEEFSITPQEITAMQEQAQNRETFTFSYTDKKQGDVVLVFVPMEITGVSDWYFITQISEQVFSQQSHTLVLMNILQVVVVSICMIVMLVMIYVGRTETLKAQATASARTEFLSTMSHEIRTPLNGIVSICHQMREHLYDPERMETYLSKLSQTSEYLVSLVSDILDMNKIQAGKLVLNMVPTDLESIFESVSDMQQQTIEEKGLRYIVDAEIMEPYVLADKIHIKQIMMNLISNACKFTGEGGTIIVRVRQNYLDAAHVETTIQVIDNGVGISRDFQKVIFDSFTQERSKVSGSTKGTGLGLTISSKLMEQMKGSLSVDSELGEGSTFTAVFPSEIIQEQKEIERILQIQIPNAEISGMRILIAEDNELNGEILKEILEEAGAAADWAKDGQETVELFRRSEPGTYDVILMDLRMPVLGGMEASRMIRNMNRSDAKDVLIFACTADSLLDTREETSEAGMNDYLSKPVDIDELLAKINQVKRRRAAQMAQQRAEQVRQDHPEDPQSAWNPAS